jgi:hypothetical protein
MILTNVLVRDVIKEFNPNVSLLSFSLDKGNILYGVYASFIEYIIPNCLCMNPKQDLSLSLKGRRIDIKIISLSTLICSSELGKDFTFLSNYNRSNRNVYTLKPTVFC